MTSPAPPPQERRPRRPRFPPEIVARAVALRRIHGLTLRKTKAAMAARGIEVSYESLRAWGRKHDDPSSPAAPAPGAPWPAQERVALLNGEPVHLWVARSPDGLVLEVLVQRTRVPSVAQSRLARLLRAASRRLGPGK
jgi:putative transposase